jgi:hypothetical protein
MAASASGVEQLGGAAHELHPVEHEVEHVGRRVERAQGAIERVRGKIMRHADAAGEQHLEGVARGDVFLDARDVGDEAVALIGRDADGGRRIRAQVERGQGERTPQPSDGVLDLHHRLVVLRAEGRVARVVRDRHRDHHARLGAQVVDDHDRIGEDEQRVGRSVAARWRRRQPLDVAHRIVAEEPDRAAPERAELGDVHRRLPAHEPVEVVERIVRRPRPVPSGRRRPVLHHPLAQPPRGARGAAQKGVARPGLAPRGRRLEQEGERPLAQLGEGRHGRIRVEQAVAPHRHEMVRPRTLPEGVEGHAAKLRA